MAAAIFAQSDGGGDRRVPVVHTSRTKRTVPAGSVGQRCGDRLLPLVRGASVPKDRKKFRGSDLSATAHVGKRDRRRKFVQAVI